MSVRDDICKLVDDKAALFTQVSDKVWSTPELGFKEFQSLAALIEVLKQEGFAVETGLAGIPTAFSGTFGSGKPVIGILGEFDALPSLSQEASCSSKKEVVKDAPGHGCGHNALGAGSLAAAVAVKDYLQATGKSGTVIYYGCPGEEFGCGKAFMAREGCFDGLDCAFSWHPGDCFAPMGISSLANISVFFSFVGRTSHAAASPQLGRSALDAAELMNIGVQFLREHVSPEARIHYAFHDVGGTAPNVVQDRAKLHYYIRAPKIAEAKELFARIEKIAKGAAMMTETESIVQIKDGLSDYIPNEVLTTLLTEAMNEVGEVPFDEEDKALAQSFRDTLTPAEKAASAQQLGMLGGPELAQKYADQAICGEVFPYRPMGNIAMPGSTDVGDVSYVTPTAQMTAPTACLGTPGHSWQQTAQAGSRLAHKGLLQAGKALALAAVKVIEDPSVLAPAQEEYLKKTGGKYNCPFPDDVKPYLD